jgi:hypothetical protein
MATDGVTRENHLSKTTYPFSVIEEEEEEGEEEEEIFTAVTPAASAISRCRPSSPPTTPVPRLTHVPKL